MVKHSGQADSLRNKNFAIPYINEHIVVNRVSARCENGAWRRARLGAPGPGG
jgi:hypothetical protein